MPYPQDFNRQNDHEQSGRTGMLICAIIGLSFLWTGCGYLSWMYRLTDFYDSSLVDIMTEVIGYLFQAAGILLFAVSEKRLLYNTLNRYSFPLLTITGLILCCLAVLSSSGPVALIFGYSMNLVFGMIGAYYLTLLSSFVEPGRAGIVFGSSLRTCGFYWFMYLYQESLLLWSASSGIICKAGSYVMKRKLTFLKRSLAIAGLLSFLQA